MNDAFEFEWQKRFSSTSIAILVFNNSISLLASFFSLFKPFSKKAPKHKLILLPPSKQMLLKFMDEARSFPLGKPL